MTEERVMRNRYLATIIIMILALEIFVGVAGADQAASIANLGPKGTNNVTVVAKFTSSATVGYAPLSVHFIDQSQNATARLWNFGDGSKSKSKNPWHTYTKAGKYSVSLTAINGKVSKTIQKKNFITVVKLKPPVAAFSAIPTYGKAPLKVKFTDRSAGPTTYYRWDFGDKQFSTAKNPTHKYIKPGKYTVTLKVGNAAGSSNKKIIKYITVKK